MIVRVTVLPVRPESARETLKVKPSCENVRDVRVATRPDVVVLVGVLVSEIRLWARAPQSDTSGGYAGSLLGNTGSVLRPVISLLSGATVNETVAGTVSLRQSDVSETPTRTRRGQWLPSAVAAASVPVPVY
jgi:hypothetical protein